MEKVVINKQKYNKYIVPQISGFLSGIIQTYAFNPIDRALYMHIKHRNKFMDPRNWESGKLMQGANNALLSRCMSYGYYYTLLDVYDDIGARFISDQILKKVCKIMYLFHTSNFFVYLHSF